MERDAVAGAAQDTSGEVVELTYRPVTEDFTSALRARTGVSRPRWRRPLLLGCAGLVLAAEAVTLAGGHAGLPLPLPAAAVASLALTLSAPWLTARQFQRLAERQGVFRTTVTESGISLVSEGTTASVTWAVQPRYRETGKVFVTFSADRGATTFTVLPKHGLAGRADIDRLRALLDRHITRC